ncbi:hypothetical protein SynSYN20_00833 [Synechococcus sp. SYN20]|nr:hypothetical protein SynSYN20_00833 [Synechococcus sp. SYN20]
MITIDTITKFISLVRGGMPQASAATAVGRDVNALRLWIQRNGMEMPHVRKPVTGDVMSYVDAYRSGRMTQKEIAIACGCSGPYVSKMLAQYTDEHIRSKQVKAFRQIIDHIKQNGGRPKATARLLGIPFNSTKFYTYVREQGIDLLTHQFAGLEYGSWLVVAGDWTKQGSNYFVRALCKKCGNTFDGVSLTNLRSGKSTCCHNCSIGYTHGRLQVKCLTTGDTFKSIRNFADAIDMSDAYQTLRLQLKQQPSIVINDREYSLIHS